MSWYAMPYALFAVSFNAQKLLLLLLLLLLYSACISLALQLHETPTSEMDFIPIKANLND